MKQEFVFTASHSSGPGGQNVKKINTKVVLKWGILNSNDQSEVQKQILRQKLKTKITTENTMVLPSQKKHPRVQNKKQVLLKPEDIITKAFAIKKKSH